jgi:tRNA-binding protein
METIEWADFARVELRVGTVLAVNELPNARRPAWVRTVDFGPGLGIKKSSAQITDLYDRASLLGRQVIAVVNFPPRQIGQIMSECLVTGFHREDGAVVLAVPDQLVPNGAKLA